jgi:uncharacterized membrane protein YfcA
LLGIDEYILLMFLISILAGLIGAMVGLGGGILVVPALTLAFGVPIEYAIGASIISTIATSSGSASAYVRDGITNLRIGMFLEIGSVIGSIVGVTTTLAIVHTGLSWVIFIVFGSVLIVSSYNVFQNARTERRGGQAMTVNTEPNPISQRFELKGEYEDKSLGKKISYTAARVPAGFTVIFFAGLLSGLLGIGGGVLKVLGMDTMMRLPFKVSTTTSNFMIGVTATASTGILYVGGYVNVILAAPVALGVVLGSYLGTKVLVRSRPVSIRFFFIVVLLLLGIEMIYMGIPH